MKTLHWEQPNWWTRICRADAEGAEGGAAGGGAATTGAPDAGGAAGAKSDLPFYEAFKNDGLKTNPNIQKFKDVEELAAGFVTLEKRFGIDPNRRLDMPADPKDAAAQKAFWQKLGTPEKADGYGHDLGAEATDADKALAGRFFEAAHAANMPKPFVDAALGFWDAEMKAAAATDKLARDNARDAGTAAIKKEWGEAFEQRSAEVGRALLKYGDADLAKALDADGMGNFPRLAIAIGKMVEAMAEPGGGAGTPGGRSGDFKLTPAQAKAESRKVEAHPGFTDARHPEHKALVEERARLLAIAAPVV